MTIRKLLHKVSFIVNPVIYPQMRLFATSLLIILSGALNAQDYIAVRNTGGSEEFYQVSTGKKFTPIGSNYIKLGYSYRPDFADKKQFTHATFGATRSIFDSPDLYKYDPKDADIQLGAMSALGYNVVRVFVSELGLNDFDDGQGLDMNYIANAVDFVKKAKNHGIRVTFAFDVWGLQNYGFTDPDNKHFSGLNTAFFTQAGINSRKAVWNDFISGLKNQGAPMNYIFGYSINEFYFMEDQLPLSLNTGMVTTANGQTYDMASTTDKSRMMQDAVVYMVGELRNAARQNHSEALVTIGFFYPEAVYGVDTRIVPEDVITTLGRSSADYFDLHAYPGYNSLQVIMSGTGSFGYKGKVVKPLLMGEFGANSGYPTAESASIAMRDWMTESCNYGFDGWLSWLWNPGTDYWNVQNNLPLQEVLNGKNWGSGCFAYPCSKTCTNDTTLIYDPKILGAKYIWKNPTIPGSCSYNLAGNHNSNYVFPLGTTIVKLNINDVTNNSTGTCAFKVTVQYSDSLKKTLNPYDSKYISQNIPSTMEINSKNTITLKYRNTGANNWNEPFPNWDVALAPSGGNGDDPGWRGLPTTVISGDTASFVFDYVPKHFGTYTVAFQLIKNGGNRFGDSSPLATFNVKDTKPPVFVCLKDTVLSNESGAGVKYSFPTPIATDNHKVVSVTQVQGLASGSTFPPGITTNVFVATDSMGNKGTCTFIVTVLKAYDAKFISQNVPSKMKVNSPNKVTLKFKNTGSLNWTAPNTDWDIALTPSGGTGEDPNWRALTTTVVSGDTAIVVFDYVPKQLGTYTVAFQLIKHGGDRFGDSSPLATFNVVDVITNLETNTLDNQIDIFPNPSNGTFTLKKPVNLGEDFLLQVYALDGRMIYSEHQKKEQSSDITLPVKDGVYFIQISIGQKSYQKRVVIQSTPH